MPRHAKRRSRWRYKGRCRLVGLMWGVGLVGLWRKATGLFHMFAGALRLLT